MGSFSSWSEKMVLKLALLCFDAGVIVVPEKSLGELGEVGVAHDHVHAYPAEIHN